MTDTQQEARTAAEVLMGAMDERGIGPVLLDDASEILDALADAGYRIVGPGQVVVDMPDHFSGEVAVMAKKCNFCNAATIPGTYCPGGVSESLLRSRKP